ncbi:hypothetical protein vseg_009370 [Gypsophila vaccaria]
MSPPPPHLAASLHTLGLGYSIAIAFAFLLLLSTLLLSSYLCCRRRHPSPHPPPSSVILPRIFFVTEDDNHESTNHSIGLDRCVINSYPNFPFSSKNITQDVEQGFPNNINNSDNSNMCSICLSDYKEAEMLRMMPDCKHYFHQCCLDAWLKLNGSCPVCRNSPLPTPVSTPLAEVIPLSLYPDNRRRSAVNSSSSS